MIRAHVFDLEAPSFLQDLPRFAGWSLLRPNLVVKVFHGFISEQIRYLYARIVA